VSYEEVNDKRISEGGENHDVQTISSPIISGVTKNEAKEEKTLKQKEEHEHINGSVTNSPQTSSSIFGKDDNWNNSTKSKGTGLLANHLPKLYSLSFSPWDELQESPSMLFNSFYKMIFVLKNISGFFQLLSLFNCF